MVRKSRRYGRASHAARRQKSSINQLLLMVVVLVLLIAFWSQLSDGAAGCFTSLTATPEGEQADAPAPAEPSEDEGPTIRVMVPGAENK